MNDNKQNIIDECVYQFECGNISFVKRLCEIFAKEDAWGRSHYYYFDENNVFAFYPIEGARYFPFWKNDLNFFIDCLSSTIIRYVYDKQRISRKEWWKRVALRKQECYDEATTTPEKKSFK